MIEQQASVEQYLQHSPRNLSGFSFVNLFAWQNSLRYESTLIDGNLCVFARDDFGVFLYLPPLGPTLSTRMIETVFAMMDRENGFCGYSRIENVGEGLLDFFPPEKFTRYLKGHEYCYYRPDIAGLKGNAYKSKRWAVNHFTKNYPHRYLPFVPEMLDACGQLYDTWADQRRRQPRDEIYLDFLEENRGVHQFVLRHAQRLGLTGRVVAIDDKIRAYTLGYPLNNDIFCVLFEIADLEFKGLSTFIFREFCADPAVRAHKFINAMDDIGLKNMPGVKMSFRPSILFPCYVITRNVSPKT